MDKKCTNCVWEGDNEVTVGPLNHCPVCGDNTIETKIITKKVETKKVNMDLNNDGKVDAKDVSIAAKVMRTVRPKRKKK